MPRAQMSDVIVLIPGILGSVLRKDGRDVWNVSGGALVPALLTAGRNLNALTLGSDAGDPNVAQDGVTAPSLLADVHLIPGLWKIDGYTAIRDTLQARFAITPGQNYFEFPYDWRRDNRVAAKQLATKARGWLQQWRRDTGRRDARLILIGHSMGGLISRYFLEVLDGWRDTRVLFTFGTPYKGSLNALDALVNGIRKGPFGLVDLSALVRSLTSAYQLLPTYGCVEDAGTLRHVDAMALPNLDPAKTRDALAFHKEITDAVAVHATDQDYRERGYAKHAVIGIGQPTLQSARPDGAGVTMIEVRNGQDERGDGTVPRVSATPQEITDGTWGMFASTAHASLQNADATLEQLDGVLSGLSLRLDQIRAARLLPRTSFAIDVDDLYWQDEPVGLELQADGPIDATVTITSIADDRSVKVETVRLEPNVPKPLNVGVLPEGAYRATIAGTGRDEPATDVFAVMRRT
jgi:hypothetical protein